MEITVGRLVHYTLNAEQVARINRRTLPSTGNHATEGDVVPFLVVKVMAPGLVNGQAFLDGNDTLWVTSAQEGDRPGTWAWPPRS
jgi:hypothetical protein